MEEFTISLSGLQHLALKKGDFIKLSPKNLRPGPFILRASPYTCELFTFAITNKKPIVWKLSGKESIDVMIDTNIKKMFDKKTAGGGRERPYYTAQL